MRPIRPRPARHPVLLALGVTLAVCGFIASTPGMANAHYVYEREHLYYTSADCVEGRSEVSHGSTGGGYYKASIWSQYKGVTNGVEANCNVRFFRPRHYLYLHIWGMKNTGGGLAICWGSYKHYNQSTDNGMSMYVRDSDGKPGCGSGWYGADSSIYMRNGDMKGGHLWSGSHPLPTTKG